MATPEFLKKRIERLKSTLSGRFVQAHKDGDKDKYNLLYAVHCCLRLCCDEATSQRDFKDFDIEVDLLSRM